MDGANLTEYRDLSKKSSFTCLVYSQIEEIGWEHLVKMTDDLTILSFRILIAMITTIVLSMVIVRDKKERAHIMEIQLEKTYPKCPPSVSADVPYIFTYEWSTNSRLKDIVQQFQMHLERLQEFWSTMDDLDRTLWVVDPKVPTRASSHRLINIGNDSFIMLSINSDDPRSLPECRFMGTDTFINLFTRKWRQNCKRWEKDKTIPDNIACVLDTELPKPIINQNNDRQTDCGICYAQFLPTDDELGANSGRGTDYTCDNSNCGRAFHSVCLVDWLRSISTTRQSFDVLFGNCPYCSDPVAVKTNNI